MFANACKIAKNFTLPFVISTKNYNNECHTGIGSLVVINEEGFFVTAFHIIAQIQQLYISLDNYRKLEAERKKVENDNSKSKSARMAILGKMKIPANQITNFSIWLGNDNFRMSETFHVVQEADVAVGKINNFDKNVIKMYPTFKDPSKPMDSGTSLCKLGFPFHSITPTFDNATGNFRLPEGSVPLPLFPIEGIYTRTQIGIKDPNIQHNHPIKFVETSSPGLRGQSGGPTFDINGVIWAIQSSTKHLPLGFGDGANDKLSEKEKQILKNQYLHVGLGTHTETIISLLNQFNIAYKISDY